jgi:hypothetical protein
MWPRSVIDTVRKQERKSIAILSSVIISTSPEVYRDSEDYQEDDNPTNEVNQCVSHRAAPGHVGLTKEKLAHFCQVLVQYND